MLKYLLISLFFVNCAFAKPAITRPVPIQDLQGYDQYPIAVKHLISEARQLSLMHLTYQYGSANPKNGGMDCSGAIHYLLEETANILVPRDANDMYGWLLKEGKIHTVASDSFSSPEFNALKPGDLLFWSGTYAASKSHGITHVMLYLGVDKNNHPLMFGSTDGRTYEGIKMWGVSVFDFLLPTDKGRARFVGYGCIPGYTCT